MEDDIIKYIQALKNLNSALFTGLETALNVIEKWDTMPDRKKEDIISSLRFLIENNREAFTDQITWH